MSQTILRESVISTKPKPCTPEKRASIFHKVQTRSTRKMVQVQTPVSSEQEIVDGAGGGTDIGGSKTNVPPSLPVMSVEVGLKILGEEEEELWRRKSFLFPKK